MAFETFRTRLGQKLQAVRREAGFSQEELAKRSHITRQHLQRLETGIGNPTMETLYNIANAVGQRLSDLLRAAE